MLPGAGTVLRDAPTMGAAKRSRTAQGVAAERAILTDWGVLHDPTAAMMLTPSMAAARWIVGHGPRQLRTQSVTLAGLAARVLWFDAQVRSAIHDGVEQIVVIGAGYDGRAWRFGHDDVRFFEVDQGATQCDKRRRAPGPGSGPTYVDADLRADDTATALLAHGLDPSKPSLFVVEGLTMYLAEDVVRSQLTGLATSTASGSRLAIDFYPPRGTSTSANRRQHQLQRLARVGSGEGFRLGLSSEAAAELVTDAGWSVDEATSLRDAARHLVPDTSGLPVDAIDEHKTLVSAHHP